MLSNYKLNADIIRTIMGQAKDKAKQRFQRNDTFLAKKKYGQNFLKDESVLIKIIESMPQNSNHIVEIGPGLGDLTKHLVKCKDVTAYEVDNDLYEILTDKFKHEIESGTLELKLTDVLEAWKGQETLYDGKYDLIANLPYYIATNIILKALEDENCESIIVMIQKEVADKFCAKTGNRNYGSLSVITESVCEFAKMIVTVPPESFEPAPKVDSAVIYIKKSAGIALEDNFKRFLKAAFVQPRKKLFKNLSSIYDKETLTSSYSELGIDENARPHEVVASMYRHLFKKVNIDDKERSRRNS